MNEDKEKVEMDYKQKLANIESLLKKEMGNQKDLMNELKQNKERVNELQSALREKRTSYESALAASSKTRESEIESLREEYNGNMLQLEREKNRQIEDEKQRRLNLEESCHNLIKSCPSPQQELHIVTGPSFPVLVLDYCSLVSVPG
jgi:YesN/AraC family two-component response regulator